MKLKRLKKKSLVLLIALVASGLYVASTQRVVSAERMIQLSDPVVTVTKSGAITASGMADCSADVRAMWPNYEGAPDVVLTNVKWSAFQRKGRTVLSAAFEDAMASPCWARPGWPWVSPGECAENADGTLHPCKWDSSNYGSSGWVFGTGAFKTGEVHLKATLDGGYYWFEGDEEDMNMGLYEIREWDLLAVKG